MEEFIANENYDNVYHVTFVDVRKTTNLTDEGLQDIKNKQWVLRFATTDYSRKVIDEELYQYYKEEIKSTLVDNVTVLRLKFETAGQIYNMGVIDNKQSGDMNPDNETKTDVYVGFIRALANLLGTSDAGVIAILVVAVAIILLAIFAPNVLVSIFKFIWQIIVWIFKGLWWLITAPMELFK